MRRLNQADDVAPAFGFKLLHKLHRSTHTAEEGRRAHSSGDGRVSTVIGEEKQPVAKLDVRHIFAKIDGPFHTPRSCPNTEQLGIETRPASLIKALTNMVSGAAA